MSLSDKTTKEIKAIIQKFITENGFTKSEENLVKQKRRTKKP